MPSAVFIYSKPQKIIKKIYKTRNFIDFFPVTDHLKNKFSILKRQKVLFIATIIATHSIKRGMIIYEKTFISFLFLP